MIKGAIIVGGVVLALSTCTVYQVENKRIKAETEVYQSLDRSNELIHAEVLSENYVNTHVFVKKHEDGSQTHPTITLESKYTIKCRTDQGQIFALSIFDGGTVTKESIDELVEVGSRIAFPQGNILSIDTIGERLYVNKENHETIFKENTQAGSKRADRITVMDYVQ